MREGRNALMLEFFNGGIRIAMVFAPFREWQTKTIEWWNELMI